MKTAISSAPCPVSFAALARRAAIDHEALTYSLFDTAQVLGVPLPTLQELLARREIHTEPGLRGERVSKRELLDYVTHRRTPMNGGTTRTPSLRR